MRLAGILESEETPSAAEATDALAVLNDMLENWSTENLSVFSTIDQTFTFTPGQGEYTIGPTGQFAGVRPIGIMSAFTRYPSVGGVDYPIQMIDAERYNLIVLKADQSQIPLMMEYDAGMPNGTLRLWPVPNMATQLTITSEAQFSPLANTAAVINYPPGYAKALRYELAVELATEFGAPVRPELVSIARNAKADIKRANKQPAIAYADPAFLQNGNISRADFIAGIF